MCARRGESTSSELIITKWTCTLQTHLSPCCVLRLIIASAHICHNLVLPQKSVPNAKVGFSKAMSTGWLRVDKLARGGPRLFRKVESVVDEVQESLRQVGRGLTLSESDLKELKKRKLVSNV